MGSVLGSLLALCFGLFGGWPGLAGTGLGFGASAVGIGSLVLLVNMIGNTVHGAGSGPMLTSFMLLLKLPILAVFAYLATRLAAPGLAGFLASVGLVYCVFVWYLMAASKPE